MVSINRLDREQAIKTVDQKLDRVYDDIQRLVNLIDDSVYDVVGEYYRKYSLVIHSHGKEIHFAIQKNKDLSHKDLLVFDRNDIDAVQEGASLLGVSQKELERCLTEQDTNELLFDTLYEYGQQVYFLRHLRSNIKSIKENIIGYVKDTTKIPLDNE